MTQFMQMHGLMPMLPEIVLALGVMVLLMVGVTAGERSARGGQWAGDHLARRGRVFRGDDRARPA